MNLGEFPGGPVVRTPRFHCHEPGLDPWSGNKTKIPQATQRGKKQKQKQTNKQKTHTGRIKSALQTAFPYAFVE